jgi:hypothetical protein
LRGLREEFVAFRKEIGEKFGRVDEKFESLRKEIDERFERLRKEIDGRFESFRREVFGEISSLRRELSTRFYWLIGILMTMWVTIILAILFKAH